MAIEPRVGGLFDQSLTQLRRAVKSLEVALQFVKVPDRLFEVCLQIFRTVPRLRPCPCDNPYERSRLERASLMLPSAASCEFRP
jgi:hypothetical protein